MRYLPDRNNWSFDRIKAVDPDRASRLENSSTSELIVNKVIELFNDAIIGGKVSFGWEVAERNSTHFRVVFQFHVGEVIFDEFFNSRNGYRAHYWSSGGKGTEFNYRIIRMLCGSINEGFSNELSLHQLNSNYDDLGIILVSKKKILQSLNTEIAKIWACTKKLQVAKSSLLLPPGVTGPKLIINSTKEWACIFREEEHAWLDIKGAFLGKQGPYQIKSLQDRENNLHENGEA